MNPQFLQEIQDYQPKLNEPLAKYTTWLIGGPAEVLVEVKSSEQLQELINLCGQYKVPYTILGGGSNVLIADEGLSGLVIINRSRNIEIVESDEFRQTQRIPVQHATESKDHYSFDDLDYEEETDKVLVKFDSGVNLPYAIGWLHKNGITGLQWFAGIPGTIGGALYNNIHGGKRHFSDNFHSATVVEKGQVNQVDFDYFQFGYDQSIIRHRPDLVILSVTLQLTKGNVPKAKETYREWNNRKKVQPKTTCGCVFKNLSVEDQQALDLPTPSAGFIIDKILNWGGKSSGDLVIAPGHANFLENRGQAKASDALNLIVAIRKEVKKKLGVDLELEINTLGLSAKDLAKIS
jgi:UDP-N-acetylmuramate dehydrogenase